MLLLLGYTNSCHLLSLSFKIPQSYFICYLSGVKETAKNGRGNGESSSWGVVAMAETHAPPPPGASLPIQPSFFSRSLPDANDRTVGPPLRALIPTVLHGVSVRSQAFLRVIFFFFDILFFPSSSSVQIARPFKFSPSTLSHNELAVPFP
jgi:hypothetical protein